MQNVLFKNSALSEDVTGIDVTLRKNKNFFLHTHALIFYDQGLGDNWYLLDYFKHPRSLWFLSLFCLTEQNKLMVWPSEQILEMSVSHWIILDNTWKATALSSDTMRAYWKSLRRSAFLNWAFVHFPTNCFHFQQADSEFRLSTSLALAFWINLNNVTLEHN